MYHEISGIEYDFKGWTDELLKFVIEDISVEELIRGTSLSSEITYLDDDGYIYQSDLELMETSELIDWRNWHSGGFMDELSSIQIDIEKLQKVRSGAAADEILTPEEIKQITDIVAEHIVLSFYYADKKILFDPEDVEEIGDFSEEDTALIYKPGNEIDSSLKKSTPNQSVQEILDIGLPIFGSYPKGMISLQRLKEYRVHFRQEPPLWLTCIAANLIIRIVELSIEKNQLAPENVRIPIKSLEPHTLKKDQLFSHGEIVGEFLVLGDQDE